MICPWLARSDPRTIHAIATQNTRDAVKPGHRRPIISLMCMCLFLVTKPQPSPVPSSIVLSATLSRFFARLDPHAPRPFRWERGGEAGVSGSSFSKRLRPTDTDPDSQAAAVQIFDTPYTDEFTPIDIHQLVKISFDSRAGTIFLRIGV